MTDDRAALAVEVERLRRLHDAALPVIDLADSALIDHDLGDTTHLASTMELLRAALVAYVAVRGAAAWHHAAAPDLTGETRPADCRESPWPGSRGAAGLGV